MRTSNFFFILILITLIICLSSCSNGKSTNATTQFAQKAYNVPEYIEPDWYGNEIDNIQCEQDQWLRVPPKIQQDALISRLVDAYNASVVWHSVMSDMEVFWRWEVNTDSAMLAMDLSIITDEQTRSKAKQLVEQSAASQQDTTINANTAMNEYLAWLTDSYNISNFFDINAITEDVYLQANDKSQWVENYDELEAKRGLSDSIYQQQLIAMMDTTTDFNVYCVLAIEYAHSSVDGPHIHEALPYLQRALTSGVYSPMLREVWQTWRAIQADEMGHSKDSDIPNAEYNQLRMICCYTMLCYIHDHPTDWLAMNNYLVTSYIDNIRRYGAFSFGNQIIMEQIEVFPEWAEKIFSNK